MSTFGKPVEAESARRIPIGSLAFDPGAGELRRGGSVRRLEPRAASVLSVLAYRAGDVVTRQELLDGCWGEGEGSDEALTQTISQIRRTLAELNEADGLIETLSKRGYRLKSVARGAGRSRSDGPASPVAPRAPISWRLPVALLAVAILALWILYPHAPRHFVRHTLGLGPDSHGGQQHGAEH